MGHKRLTLKSFIKIDLIRAKESSETNYQYLYLRSECGAALIPLLAVALSFRVSKYYTSMVMLIPLENREITTNVVLPISVPPRVI
jgi:hypothetical protein